jgi:hypothetical protein
MVTFTNAFVAAAIAGGVLASPVAKRNSPNAQGTSGGFFYQFCESIPEHTGSPY